MISFFKYSHKDESPAFPAQLFCLLLAGILEFLVMTAGRMFEYKLYYLLRIGCGFSCFSFWLVSLLSSSRKSVPRNVILGMIMALWFLIVELQHRCQQMDSAVISLFFVIYLVAFPFAALTRDETEQKGIRLIAGIYITAALILLINGFLLMIGQLPEGLQSYVHWDGTRLQSVHHPNITARIFMVGIAFCLGFLGQSKTGRMKAVLLISAILLFAGMAFTNSRSCILITCLLPAGNIFFAIHNGRFKNFLLGATAALLTAAVLFLSANALYHWNSARLLSQFSARTAENQQASHIMLSNEPPAYVIQQLSSHSDSSGNDSPSDPSEDIIVSSQGSWLSDLSTLNSRTVIWKTAFHMIRNSPRILFWGTDDTEIAGPWLQSDHTHNSWLEVLLRLGLPGFLISILFTWKAVWSSLSLLRHHSGGLWKKNIAMLVLSLLVTSFVEPVLFFTTESFHFIDFVFFLCLGYLIPWKERSLHNN